MARVSKKRTIIQWIALAAAITAVILIATLWVISRSYRPAALKDKIVALLSDQLESEVTLDSLEGSFFPRIALSGGGLVVRHKGRTDVPPLLTIEHFEIRASLRALMHRPRHVSEVRLSGLQVHIPPSDDSADDSTDEPVEEGSAQDELRHITIDRFEAPDTVLTLIPRKPHKPPKVFTIHHLVMENVGRGHIIPYLAVLTNPVPQGQIEASGRFGPWNLAHPASTPVSGKYTFANADLDTIDGLAGILSSEGTFDGPLKRIHVRGTTDTPKFQVDAGGQPVPLKTEFDAIVDGSDGDTILQQVNATFLNTALTAKGAVIGLEGVPGRRVEVDVHVSKGRIEDLLRLAMDSPKPLLRGDVRFDANLIIPPQKAKVMDKMVLHGTFGLTKAKFTDASVQTKIADLSRHGRGLNNDESPGEVVSNLQGKFVLQNAAATFP